MPDSTLQDIKERLNVVDVISSYIPVKKSGSNFKAACPFHNEKTASLMISPQKQIWHCFGCGEGGDVFGFVMRYENLEFREVLPILAQQAGVVLPERGPARGQEKKITEELTRINNFAAKYYQKLLGTEAGKEARGYLEKRGLTQPTIDQWGIGYSPDSFDSLLKALQAKKVDSKIALQAGVLAQSEKGKVFDRFRDRVMFPIHNYYGDIVGFSARLLKGEEGAKYINSPETPIYNKSKILFGLHFAREAIRKAEEVVIVEGQMDVISVHQGGFANTVATSGTALTEDHLRLLGRLTKNLKFCFDADSAGLQALRRAGELALPLGFRIKVIKLEGAKDPDELVKKSPRLWKKAVADGVWFIDYYLDVAESKFVFGSLEQKQYISEEVAPLLQFATDPLEQDHYMRTISERFGVSESAVRALIKPGQHSSSKETQPTPTAAPVTQETVQEKEILGGMLIYPEYRQFVQEEGFPSEYISESLRGVMNSALLGESIDDPGLQPLVNEATFMIESSLDNLANNELALLRELKKSFYLFKLAGIKRTLQDTTTAIKKAESLNDAESVKHYNQLFAQISNQRYTLEQKLES